MERSSLIGILFDVSGSMREALPITEAGSDKVERAHALLSLLATISAKETERHRGDDHIFFELFGLATSFKTCDLISLLKPAAKANYSQFSGDGHARLVQLAQRHGVGHIEKWIRKHLNLQEASILHLILGASPDKIHTLVSKIPSETTTTVADKAGVAVGSLGVAVAIATGGIAFVPLMVVAGFATSKGVDNRAKNSEALQLAQTMVQDFLAQIAATAPHSIANVSQLLKQLLPNSESDNLKPLLETIKPFIYGRETPMVYSLKHAQNIFQTTSASKKVLVVVSDGDATDGDPIVASQNIKDRHKDSNISIITCFLTAKSIPNSKELHYSPQRDWSPGEKALFLIATTVHNSTPPLPLLGSAQWILPSAGVSRLFIRANNLDLVNEFSGTLVSHLSNTKSLDSFIDIVGKVNQDFYINKLHQETQAAKQVGGTCYANAVAYVFYLAMHRIVGRNVPPFDEIRAGLIKKYGSDGAPTAKVLINEAGNFRLRFKEVDEVGARQAINMRRPVIATFRLDDTQWEGFSKFFHETPEGVLKRAHVGELIDRKFGGHAVILVRIDPESLMFMNSWGDKWANRGCFRIQDSKVLSNSGHPMRFYDVYYTLADLLPEEKKAFLDKSVEESKRLADEYPSIRELNVMCPACKIRKPIDFYGGHCLSAICSNCEHVFKPTGMELLNCLKREIQQSGSV